ncbi:uncharacterized protein LOC129738231 isoform X2 [Uranotaenia lowii]|uniref:uncharacterized protein LOC129738231 isoform X2 n=1 Tax=Uranotaenia lowii TaxID=190385 RepID=UPI002479F5DA|nr:uncharacterized protein LOC129738231 isoform X2 [Uranotaenia lowii]
MAQLKIFKGFAIVAVNEKIIGLNSQKSWAYKIDRSIPFERGQLRIVFDADTEVSEDETPKSSAEQNNDDKRTTNGSIVKIDGCCKIVAMDVHEQTSRLAVATNDKSMYLFEILSDGQEGIRLLSRRITSRTSSCIRFAPSGAFLIVCDKSGDCYRYECDEADFRKPGRWLLGHLSQILDVIVDERERMSLQDFYNAAVEELDIEAYTSCEFTPMEEREPLDNFAKECLLRQLFEFFKEKGPKVPRFISAELKKHKVYYNCNQVEQKLLQLGFQLCSVPNQNNHTLIRGRNFTEVEDIEICRAWKAVSNDASIGTDQTRTSFWARIQTYAARYQPALAARAPDALRQRFGFLKKHVQKYLDCEVFAFRNQTSGTSREDVLSIATRKFMMQNNLKEFKLQGCIDVLRNEPKFCTSVIPTKTNDNTNTDNITDSTQHPPTQATSHLFDTPMTSAAPTRSESRPLGKKAAKSASTDIGNDVMKKLVESINRKNDVLSRNAKALEEATTVKIMATPVDSLDDVAKEYFMLKKQKILRDLQKENETFDFIITESDSD